MRLLFLNHNYRYGGTYYRAFPMAEQLARRGHDVTLLTVSREHRWRTTWSTTGGVRIGETPNWGQDNSGEGYGPIDNVIRCVHVLLHRYDIIHMLDHKPNASFPAFVGAARAALRVADWVDWWGGAGGINDVPQRRVPAVGKFEAWWEVRSKLWADGVVTISRVLAQRAIDIGCPPERVLYLPTGAATERINPIQIDVARRNVHIPPERRIVGFIGMGQSDLEIVMSALAQLPDVWLMIVGHRNEKVLALANAFGIADRLWQTGFVPDEELANYLAVADVMCLPMTDRAANRGRLPNKLLDYMAAGRPVVASPVGDVRTIMETYDIGLLASDDTFGGTVSRLLNDAGRREELGRSAREVAETAFGWSPLIGRLEAFYERLLETRSRAPRDHGQRGARARLR